MFYRQCKLQKNNKFEVSFIPEQFARKGKRLKINNDDGWYVVEVGNRLREDLVIELSQDYKHQRSASDI